MKKILKLYLITLITSITLLSPAFAQQDITSIPFKNTVKTKLQSKIPIGRKALAMKFIIAMLGVGASSVIIYVGLSVYNRFIYGTPTQKRKITEDEEYKTPNNMKDALTVFLKKTK